MPAEIFSVNGGVILEGGQGHVPIQCIDAGFTAGTVVVSPTDSVTDSLAVTLTADSWTDDYIEVSLPSTVAFEFTYWFVVDINGFSNFAGYELEMLTPGVPVTFSHPPKGLSYQGRDGEIRFLDKSQASVVAKGTPWGLKVRFSQMSLSVGFRSRPEENTRLSRQRLNRDMHFVVGSEDPLFSPSQVAFAFAMSSRETDSLPQFIGTDWMQKANANTADSVNPWTVKGTPSAGLVSTKGRAVRNDGLYAGGIINGKGSVVVLPSFIDKKKVAVDMEVIWQERNGSNKFGYRLKEVYFAPNFQTIKETDDYVIIGLLGTVYGEMQRISQFSRSLDVLTTRRME